MVSFNKLMSMSPKERAAHDARVEARRSSTSKPTSKRRSFQKHTPPKIETRQEGEEVFKTLAKMAHPEASTEIAIGRYAATDEGKRLYAAMSHLPSRPAPVPVEKATSEATPVETDAGQELEREAVEIAKREGISTESAMGKAARARPDLTSAHNQEIARALRS